MVYIHSPKQLNKTAADASVACPHSGTSHVGVNQRRPKQVPIKTMYHIQYPKTSALQGNYIWSKIAQALWSLKPKGLFLKGMVMYYGLIILSNKIIAETVEIIKMIWI